MTMPIDFFNGNYYEFDFKALTEIPKNIYNSKNFCKYLNDWNVLLHKLDKISRQEYNLFVDMCNSNLYRPEFYQFTQKYIEGYNPYIFNFNIEHILSNIKRNRYKKRLITVKKLSKIVSYDNTIILDGRKVKIDPIVICSFILPKSNYIMLDGNTRMNYYLKTNKIFTKYIHYDITNKNDFLLSVDWAMYNFINEFNILIHDYKDVNKMETNINGSKIFSQAFICEANRNYTYQ